MRILLNKKKMQEFGLDMYVEKAEKDLIDVQLHLVRGHEELLSTFALDMLEEARMSENEKGLLKELVFEAFENSYIKGTVLK